MRELLKKYYEMEEKTKENLGTLYIIHEFESIVTEFEKLNISSLGDTEIIIKLAVECWHYSNIDGGEILYRLLHLLSENEITVEELKEMEIEKVVNLISFWDSEFKETVKYPKIYKEFVFEDLKCTILNDNEKLILVYEKGNSREVLIFRTFTDMLCHLIRNSRLELL